MHDPVGADDLGAEGVADALVAQADAQQRDPSGRTARITSLEIPASFGVHGPGEMMMWLGRLRLDLVERDLVVADDEQVEAGSISPRRWTRL